MALKDLFKSKAERRAYAKGRRDQFNKEHPKLRWGVVTNKKYFNSDGSLHSSSDGPVSGYRTKKEALEVLRRAHKTEKMKKERFMRLKKEGKINEHNSHDCSYDESRLVRINKRKGV